MYIFIIIILFTYLYILLLYYYYIFTISMMMIIIYLFIYLNILFYLLNCNFLLFFFLYKLRGNYSANRNVLEASCHAAKNGGLFCRLLRCTSDRFNTTCSLSLITTARFSEKVRVT